MRTRFSFCVIFVTLLAIGAWQYAHGQLLSQFPWGVPLVGTGTTTLTGLVLGNGASPMTAYAGTTCTNQFVRALSALGAATCNTVSLTADVTGVLPVTNGGARWQQTFFGGTSASATQYVGFGANSATEADVASLAPVNATCRNLFASVKTAPGVGNSWAVVLRVNAATDTALTCTISGATTTCNDTTHTGALTQNQAQSVKFTATTPSATIGFAASMECYY